MPDAADQWTELYRKGPSKRYPDEAVVRIFLGTYPNLKMPRPKRGQSILDVGCGDGCNFHVFEDLGMKMAGTEITPEIVDAVARRLRDVGETGLDVDLRIGTCASLPWPDATFDYMLSWNSCYYLNEVGDFDKHVDEMARVIKPGGWIVCSVPKPTCFIFNNAEFLGMSHVRVRDDYFGLRNGQLMRWFPEHIHIEHAFGDDFANFCFASIEINMFGLAYDWHVFTAERRT